MPAGIEIYNDAGTILINDRSPNLTLRAMGDDDSVFIPPVGGSAGKYMATCNGTNVGSIPMVATSCPIYHYYDRQLFFSSDGGVTFNGAAYVNTSAVANVKFWLFNKPVAPGGAGYGLQVFDASGNLCFDARLKHARVVEVFVITSTSTVTKTYTSGRTYAIIAPKVPGAIVANQVQMFPGPNNIGMPVIVLDVTGY